MTRFDVQPPYRRLKKGGNPGIWLAALFALMVLGGFGAAVVWQKVMGNTSLTDLLPEVRVPKVETDLLTARTSMRPQMEAYPTEEFLRHNKLWAILSDLDVDENPPKNMIWSHRYFVEYQLARGRVSSHVYHLFIEVYLDGELVQTVKERLEKNEDAYSKDFDLQPRDGNYTFASYIGRQSNARSSVPCSGILVDEGSTTSPTPVVHTRPRKVNQYVTLFNENIRLADNERPDRLSCEFEVTDPAIYNGRKPTDLSNEMFQVFVEDRFGTVSIFDVTGVLADQTGNFVVDSYHPDMRSEDRFVNRKPLKIYLARQIRNLKKSKYPGILEEIEVLSNTIYYD